jgi:hypothetical protein
MLTVLTGIISEPGERPGWFIPPPQVTDTPASPSGEAVTGIAHGIAGPVAFLAAAAAAGMTVDRQGEAVHVAANWLVRWRCAGTWPPAITGAELASGIPDPMPGRRDAWCYGTPGIARALIMAGHALRDRDLIRAARNALDFMAEREARNWDAAGPTVCHGYSGVLLSTMRDADAIAACAAERVVAAFNPRFRYEFRHESDSIPADRPGLLTGAAGIALALADYSALPCPAVPTPWDAALLLA